MWLEIARLLDTHMLLYWGPGFALLFLTAYLAQRPLPLASGATAQRADALRFLVIVALCLLAFRAPSFLYLDEINSDESQLITNARRFLSASIPWRDVDTTTSGPINSYVLVIPTLLGIPISYPSLRITGLVLLLCTLILSYLTIRTLCNERAARLAILPSVALLGVTQDLFFDYTTGMLPIALLAAAVWLFARAARRQARAPGAYVAGLCLGAVPFAKLQAGPLAVLVFGLAFFLREPAGAAAADDLPKRNSQLYRLWLFAGGATVPLAMIALLLAGNALDDAWRSYILTPLFIGSNPLHPREFLAFLLKEQPFVVYASTMLLLGLAPFAVAWWFRPVPASRENDAWIVATALYGLVTIYVVWKGANPWPQYLLFFVHPLTLLAGLLWHRALGANTATPRWHYPKVIAVAASALFIAWTFASMRTWSTAEGKLLKTLRAPVDPVSQLILKVAGSDRHFTVWGSMPRYYVKTGLQPSTRDVLTQFQIQTNPFKAYYIERYLKDFKAARPNVFVEATGQGNHTYFWAEADPKHSAVPELARIIREDFVLVYDIARCGTPETRIYVRKSRWRELGGIGTQPLETKLCLPAP